MTLSSFDSTASVVFRFDGYLSKTETAKKVGRDIFQKGDCAFLSGDIVVQDEYGYIYFQDRTGDTFRWHGENVSSAEVESIISKALGLCDVVVYGVKIPDLEGKAGMAAIVDQDGLLDVGSLAEKLKPLLPSYAIPVFVRVVTSVSFTGTFKFQKYELKKEGFDINVVKDKLYYYDSKSNTYVSLDENLHGKIIGGKVRL